MRAEGAERVEDARAQGGDGHARGGGELLELSPVRCTAMTASRCASLRRARPSTIPSRSSGSASRVACSGASSSATMRGARARARCTSRMTRRSIANSQVRALPRSPSKESRARQARRNVSCTQSSASWRSCRALTAKPSSAPPCSANASRTSKPGGDALIVLRSGAGAGRVRTSAIVIPSSLGGGCAPSPGDTSAGGPAFIGRVGRDRGSPRHASSTDLHDR